LVLDPIAVPVPSTVKGHNSPLRVLLGFYLPAVLAQFLGVVGEDLLLGGGGGKAGDAQSLESIRLYLLAFVLGELHEDGPLVVAAA